MLKISDIRYPDLNAIIRQYPNPRILLGHTIYWQEKRDGSNIGAESFNDIKKVMLLFARYVSIECKKHICAKPKKNLFKYYKEKLEDF